MTTDEKDGVAYTGVIQKANRTVLEKNPRELIMDKKMQELREFGKEYGAIDTKKTELIDEILDKVPDDKLNEFLEVK